MHSIHLRLQQQQLVVDVLLLESVRAAGLIALATGSAFRSMSFIEKKGTGARGGRVLGAVVANLHQGDWTQLQVLDLAGPLYLFERLTERQVFEILVLGVCYASLLLHQVLLWLRLEVGLLVCLLEVASSIDVMIIKAMFFGSGLLVLLCLRSIISITSL